MGTKSQDYKAKVQSQKQFKKVPHQFKNKIFQWLYCSGCGLVNLKNEATRKRMQQPCESMED